eukprot:71780_1
MAPSLSPSAAPTRPAGSVGDGETTAIIDINNGNNQEAINKNTSGHMIYVYLGIAGAVMIICCVGVFVWKYKRQKEDTDTFKRSIEMNRLNSQMSNNPQMVPTNSSIENINDKTFVTDGIMGDVIDLMLTPMGPSQEQ